MWIAASSFAPWRHAQVPQVLREVVDGRSVYSVESVAKFSMIHRDERSAKAAAFADAKMQMVAVVRYGGPTLIAIRLRHDPDPDRIVRPPRR